MLKKIIIGGSVSAVAIIAIAAALGSNNGDTGAPAPAPVSTRTHAASNTASHPRTVTFLVKGSDATVTYGPAGSNRAGKVPMVRSIRLGHAMYYALSAQLNGSGKITCEILIDGKVISKASASGSYNIADCEISRGVLSGKWTDTNQS